MKALNQAATAHSAWLDRLSDHYRLPRIELIRMLDRPFALEYEIARLISTAARSKAQSLLAERERPDEDSPDLFDRAVCGHWRRLRDAEILASADQLAEVKALLSDSVVEVTAVDG